MNEFLEKLSAERCTDLEVRNTINIAQVFNHTDALDVKSLFFIRFCRIPNWIQLTGIDCKKAGKWIVQNHKDNIADCCYIKRYNKRKGMYFDDVYYFLFDDLLVYLNENASEAKILFRKTDSVLVDKVAGKIKRLKKAIVISLKYNCLSKMTGYILNP